MAHANPEFALACRAYRDPPLRHATPGPASLADLRSRMRDIGERIAADAPHTAAEAEAYQLWLTSRRLTRRDAAVRVEMQAAVAAGPAMHRAGRRGERFTEPKRRVASNVQAGRVKRDCRGSIVEG